MAGNINPGPIETDLLWMGESHRAANVFKDNDNKYNNVIKVRRCDQTYYQHLANNPIPPNVMQYIDLAGFGGIARCGFHKIDHALLTALIERWRPETQTFHFPIGEATITLQDVQVLWGLNVDGFVVSGTNNLSDDDIVAYCQSLLGFNPPLSIIKGSTIQIPALVQVLNNPLPADATEEQLQQRARVYILIFIGGILLPDLSGNRVSLSYLVNIIDLQDCSSLSWGSAVLAYLYKQLSKAVVGKLEIGGSVLLLQLWAWERFNSLAPTITHSDYNFQAPRAARLVFLT